MNDNKNLNNSAELLKWIGGTKGNSRLESDLNGLKEALPTLALAKLYASDDAREELEAAIECVTLTIANLRDLKNEVAETVWDE